MQLLPVRWTVARCYSAIFSSRRPSSSAPFFIIFRSSSSAGLDLWSCPPATGQCHLVPMCGVPVSARRPVAFLAGRKRVATGGTASWYCTSIFAQLTVFLLFQNISKVFVVEENRIFLEGVQKRG